MAERVATNRSRKDPEPESGGRAYQRARQDRGIETRERLIEAALDIFGRQGFEGATTREIAKAAKANLAAIVYHFGSKEALYRAVAEHIVEKIATNAGGLLSAVESQLAGIDAAAARRQIHLMVDTFVDVIVGNPEAERWARFLLRELVDPTDAFEIIYRFIGNAHAVMTRLVAIACDADPESTGIKLKTFAILGQGLVFRVGQNLVLRRLGREALGPAERAEIKRILAEHLRVILGDETNVS